MTPEPIGTAGVECLRCRTTFRVNVYSQPSTYVFRQPNAAGFVQVDQTCELTTAPLEHDCPARAA